MTILHIVISFGVVLLILALSNFLLRAAIYKTVHGINHACWEHLSEQQYYAIFDVLVEHGWIQEYHNYYRPEHPIHKMGADK